jgi:glycosyltransferase involved in cell wall biosynthesis
MAAPFRRPIQQIGDGVRSVAILTPWFPNLAGDRAGAFVADSARALMRAGWRVGVLVVRPWIPLGADRFAHEMVRGDIDASAFHLSALEIVRVPALPRLILRPILDILSDRLTAIAFRSMVRSISADLVHAQTEGVLPVASQVARALRLPLVVTLHGVNMYPRYLHSRYQMRRFRPVLASTDRIILVGDPLRECFKNYIGTDQNFEVVPNGIDAPPLRSHKKILDCSPVRLVSVANLHEGKGIDLTLLALAGLLREGTSNWTYRIIGEGREKPALVKLAADLCLADKVTFVGAVRHEEIFDYLLREEIFVLPSYREAFGIVYLEAMAAGLLTIGVAGQGPSQFIKNGENGILVPPHDVGALVAALRDVVTGNRGQWRQIVLKGQQTALDGYTWDSHAKRLIAVYEDVIIQSGETKLSSFCGDGPYHRVAPSKDVGA